jgi:predicted permease
MIIKLVYNVALLFIMMLPGFLMKKCNLATDGLGKGISNLVLYIAQPALVFLAYTREFSSEILINSLWVLIFSVIAHTVFAIVAKAFFSDAPGELSRMLRFATIFSNAAFMGIPLISAIFGDEATIYASVYNISFNLFLWSLGVKICTEKRDEDGDGVAEGFSKSGEHLSEKKKGNPFLKVLLHPVTIASALGLIVFCFSLGTYLPGIVTESLGMLSALVAPLSMTVIGMRIADIDLRGFFKDKHMYIFLLLRHIVLPALVLGIVALVALIPGIGISSVASSVVIIMAATPAATSATMFAEMYECDAAYTSKLVVVSTIVSIVTMPAILYLSSMLGIAVS